MKVKRGWQVVKGCTVLSGRSGIPTVCPWAYPRALLPAHLTSEARELWSFVMWMSMVIGQALEQTDVCAEHMAQCVAHGESTIYASVLVFLGVGAVCPGSFVARGTWEMANQGGFGVQAAQISGASRITIWLTHQGFRPVTCTRGAPQ